MIIEKNIGLMKVKATASTTSCIKAVTKNVPREASVLLKNETWRMLSMYTCRAIHLYTVLFHRRQKSSRLVESHHAK